MKKVILNVLLILLGIALVNVNAAETHPNSITYAEKETPIQNASGDQADYHNGTFYHMFSKDDEQLILCMDYPKNRGPLDGDQTLVYKDKSEDGITCIVKNMKSGTLADNEILKYQFQVFGFAKGEEVPESKCELTFKEDCDVKGTIKAEADNLVLELDDSRAFYVSDLIKINRSDDLVGVNYKAEIDDPYEGMFLVQNLDSSDALDQNSMSVDSFYIKIPAGSVSSPKILTLTVSAKKDFNCTTKKYYTAYYQTNRTDKSYQRFVYTKLFEQTLLEQNKTVSDSSKLSFDFKSLKIFISKKDITNVEGLAGAKIKISCANGYNKTFTTTKEATEIEALLMINTKCKLTEIEAPEGYEKITNPLTFAIDKNRILSLIKNEDERFSLDKNTITIYNGSYPITGSSTWIIITVLGVILIGSGSFIIFRIMKKKNDSKTNKSLQTK